jgi:hypothetical protein
MLQSQAQKLAPGEASGANDTDPDQRRYLVSRE